MKSLILVLTSLCLLLALLAPGCGQLQQEPPPELTTMPEATTHGGTAPAPPIIIDLSFPNGAPRLNEMAELRCVAKIHSYTTNLKVDVHLSDAFELVSGNLSWAGENPTGEIEAIEAVVRSVQNGNWTIEALVSVGA